MLSVSENATTVDQPNFGVIKQRQQATWASGDFAVVGTTLQIVGESLAEAVDLPHGGRRKSLRRRASDLRATDR